MEIFVFKSGTDFLLAPFVPGLVLVVFMATGVLDCDFFAEGVEIVEGCD